MSRNPIKYVIQRHHELFQKDEATRVQKKKQELYKKHVHTPLPKDSATMMTQKTLIANVTRLQPYIVRGDSFREHVETLISYNLRNDGFQQDCIYIEQGHLITPTTFMTHSMAIDPRRSVVVSWTPIPLCILQVASLPWCPSPSPSSTSQSN